MQSKLFLILLLVGCSDAVKLGDTPDSGKPEDAAGLLDSPTSDPTVFAPAQTPDYLVVDGANVYWADRGTLYGKAKSGGSAWIVATAASSGGPPSVSDLGVDATGVYYAEASANGSAIRKAPLLGGAPPVVVAQSETIACFTIAGSDVYYSSQFVSNTPGGAIYKTTTAGGAGVVVIDEPQSTHSTDQMKVTPLGLAVDGTNVFWKNLGPDGASTDTWGVASATLLLGSTASRIGDVTPHQSGNCKSIAVDDTNVYWGRGVPSPAIVSAPKKGGPEIVLTTSNSNFVVEGGYVYYVAAPGDVLRMPTTGGTPEILARGQNHPFAVAVDATHVYWTNLGTYAGGKYAGDGAVMQVAKP